MHGEEVFELRPFWHSSEVQLLSNCCDSLSILMAIPAMRERIEAVLIALYQEFDARFVLLANERQTTEAKQNGLDYSYAVPVLSTRYDETPPPSLFSTRGPVFSRPAESASSESSASAVAPPPSLDIPSTPTTGPGDQFPLVLPDTGYESDSEDGLSDNEGDDEERDEGDTAYLNI